MNTNAIMHNHILTSGTARMRPLSAMLIACFGLAASLYIGPAVSNPIGPQVVNGKAEIVQQGNILTITNSHNAIINWQNFSINADEITRFVQPGSTSSVLNRVQGQYPSQILGALQSNGKVFLINPNGILFGGGARVDVAGMVASSLNLSNEDFLAGKRNFVAGDRAEKVENRAAITTPGGGQVFLLAPNVENNGLISAPNGDIVLAAGRSVQLVDSGNPDLHVVVSAPQDQAINLGKIISHGGRVGIYGALVNQRGNLNANSAVLGANGKIVLKASREATLDNASQTSATGAGRGGEIAVLGQQVALNGNAQIDASGAQGGGTVLLGGDYQGGNAQISNAERTFVSKSAGVRADATQNGNGGKIIVWSDKATQAYGSLSARGAGETGNGGLIEVSSKKYLDFRARTSLAGGSNGKSGKDAKNGKGGTLLLDPETLLITGGTNDGETDGTAVFQGGESPGTLNFDDSLSVVYQSELEGIGSDTSIVLEATRRIETSGTFTNGKVQLQTNNDLLMRTRNDSNDPASGAKGIDLTTSTHGSALEFKTAGSGSITLQASSANYQLADLKAGALSTAGGAISLSAKGNVQTDGAISSAGGAITLTGQNVTVNGVSINSGAGHQTLTAAASGGTLTLAPLSSLTASSSGVGDGIDLVADNLTLPLTGNAVVNLSGAGRVLIQPHDTSRDTSISETKSGNKLEIIPAGLNRISADTVLLNSNAAQAVDSALTLSTVKQLKMLGSSVSVNDTLDVSSNNGSVFLGAGTAVNVGSNGKILTHGAQSQITLLGDSMTLGGASASINPNGGKVTLAPYSSGAAINVGAGATSSAGVLGLAESQLRTITTSGDLEIGSTVLGWSGNLAVTGNGLDLTGAGLSGSLVLNSGGSGGNLAVHGALKAPGTLFINTSGLFSTGNNASISANNLALLSNRMDLQGGAGTISVNNNGTVVLAPLTNGNKLNLGAVTGSDSVSNTLELSAQEIATVGTAAKLRLGTSSTSDISLVGPITRSSGVLTLQGNSTIEQSSGAIITANKLAINTQHNVNLPEPNMVGNLAVSIGNSDHANKNLTFKSAQSLNIGSALDGFTGVGVYVDNSQYDVQAPSGVVKLSSTGDLTQSTGALISAKALYAEGKKVVLTEANQVPNLAGVASGTVLQDVFQFKNNGSFLVNQVSGFHGIAQNGPDEAAAVYLISGSGDVSQTSSASITTAGNLKVSSAGAVNLNVATGNSVGSFSAAANGAVAYANTRTQGLTVGANGLGVSSGNGNITISAGSHPLLLAGDVAAGTGDVSLSGSDVQLGVNSGVNVSGANIVLIANAADGQIRTAGGASNVGTSNTAVLGLVADILDFTNGKPGFTAHPDSGVISVRPHTDDHTLTLGTAASWSANAVAFGEADSSKSYTSGDITISAPLTVSNKLGIFTGGNVSQSAPITAPKLVVSAGSVRGANGSVILNANNQVGNISARTNGGEFSLTNQLPLSTGLFTEGSMTIDGITTSNGNLGINNTGAVVIDRPLSSGSGAINVVAHSPLTVNAAVSSSSGNITLEAGSSSSSTDKLIVGANGSVVSNSGNITLKAGDAISVLGTVNSQSGSVTQTPNQNPPALPSLNDCIANPALPGCSSVLPSLASCIATPSLPGCSVVLPSLTACIAAPTLPGCSVVLPSLAACTAQPSLPGCAVVLPSLASCIATPTLPGCSVVLPSLASCIATPTLPGCSVVLPSLAACTAQPGLPGCAVVLPSLASCIATPSLPGCSAVLPSLASCTENPGLPGCSVVLPSLASCIATPSLPGCSAVLPSLAACTAQPGLPGCAVVLPGLASCIATPSLPGCSAVLPSLASCTENPGLPGCAVVLPSLASCIATPSLPGCSAVLPSLASCIATPGLPGCTVVLPSLNACIATPTLPGCSAVLPSLASCTENPSLPGCAVVLPTLAQCVAMPSLPGCSAVLPGLAACSANPTLPGCAAILPSLSACIATPGLPGCAAVLPNLATCIASPVTPGCSVVLPDLASCTAAPDLPGCSAVLPSLSTCIATPSLPACSVILPSIGSCSANPALPGCTVVLPSLASCIATPAQAGCSAVLPSLAICIAQAGTAGCTVILPTLASCIASPTLPGCSAVLPGIAACSANPAAAGCAQVLPTLSACVAAPGLPGCSVVLPSLSQCIAKPTATGCAQVLPSLAICSSSPKLAGCEVVLPATQSGNTEPVTAAIDSSINIINTASNSTIKPSTAPTVFASATAVQKPDSNASGSSSGSSSSSSESKGTDSKSDSKKDEKKDDPSASTKDSGVKKDEPAKKLYCN